jgi:uncharacterized protein YbjT (DUF2867 family)
MTLVVAGLGRKDNDNMILVTGATGLAGSAVIREFAQQQLPVRALVRNPAKAAMFDGLATVEVIEGDMLRPQTLAAAFEGVDRALMISSPREQMVDTQCTFIDAAKAAGVLHIVKFSGMDSGIGFDHDAFRASRWHGQVERYLEGSGLAWTHLRPTQFMQYYLPGTLTGVDPTKRELVMPIGASELAPVDIEDIAKVAVALLRAGGHQRKSYYMSGPQALTMTEVVEQISEATGTTFRYSDVSFEQKRTELVAAGLPPDAIDLLDELFKERRRCTKSTVDLNTHKTFGVEPTTFAQFAWRHATGFLRQPDSVVTTS